jgi:hypothetical protein
MQPSSGRFPDLFGDWAFEPGTVTDLWGLVLGALVLGLTIWVARRQLQIMNQQTEMMREQSEAAKRMEAITRRQGEIADMQHQIFLERRGTSPELRLSLYSHTYVNDPENQRNEVELELLLVNQGKREALGCQYMIGVGASNEAGVEVRLSPQLASLKSTPHSHKVAGYLDIKIFPGVPVEFCTIGINAVVNLPELVWCHWQLSWSEGSYPPEGRSPFCWKLRLIDGRYTLQPYEADNLSIDS